MNSLQKILMIAALAIVQAASGEQSDTGVHHTLQGALTPSLSHPMKEGARRAGEGSRVSAPGDLSITIRFSPADGLGPQKGVMRRDPSDIIKADGRYYVWYTKALGNVQSGYDATVWYATSSDGHTWAEQGEALARGPVGSWDEQSVFTPNILVAKGKYWLFYTAVPKPFHNSGTNITKTAIGIAVSDTPDGPWTKLKNNPVLTASDDRFKFDSLRVDDACLIVRHGKYWLYFKGRQWDNTPAHTKLGVAIADSPEGPYVNEGNPVVGGGHEVLVWPYGSGVVAFINIGPQGIRRTLQYAPDGLHFSRLADLSKVPGAPGAYRPEAFTDSGTGEMPRWGVCMGYRQGFPPFLQRFDWHPVNDSN